MLLGQDRIIPVHEYVMAFPQLNQLFIVVENGIGVSQSLLGVNLRIVWIHGQPRCTGGESGLRFRAPLHGSTPIVAAFDINGVHNFFLRMPRGPVFLIHIQDFNILIVAYRVKFHVGHADFFALVDVRRALECVQQRSQHFGRLLRVVLIISEAGQHARLVMIVQVKAVPALAMQRGLPFGED
ncbi:hypothetical protein D3C75_878880 [compost metagenome]